MRKVILFTVAVTCMMLCGCRTQYVPVVETHDVHHYHTDTVRQTDSILSEKTTVIRQLDSAAMAQYGIEMRNAERAWLVVQKDMEKRIKNLMSHKHDSIYIRDSIQVPVPVEKKLTRWQQAKIDIGEWMVGAVIASMVSFIVIWMRRSHNK